MPEPVLVVWDLYDGVRSGIALYRGEAHYFDCEFDVDADDYRNVFRLWPLSEDLLTLAAEQWQIFRAWERRFHSGKADVQTHPGHRGQNARYDEIEDRIDEYLNSLGTPAYRLTASFEAKKDQPAVLPGRPEMEVTWLEIAEHS